MVSDSEEYTQPRRPPTYVRFVESTVNFFEAPVIWFRKTIVEPNRKEYYWYHQKFRRVPTVDQCYDDDPVCKWEAAQQFIRDQLVDSQILAILRQRYEHCMFSESPNTIRCRPLWDTYEEASGDWFCKYGDLGYKLSAEKAYFKQKHRLVWERRHGKVGTGTEGNRPPPKEPEKNFFQPMPI